MYRKTLLGLGLCVLLFAASYVYADIAIQNPDARTAISLDGRWDIIIDPYENGFYNHRYEESPTGYFKNAKPADLSELVEYDFASSQKLNVPGDWNTQDDKLFFYEGTIWYHRDINLNPTNGQQYLIYFGAVNYQATVYFNGKKVGQHEGGFTPFQFDVTALVAAGVNSIVVKVDNRRERDQVPTVNTDWWNYGGITRSVKIITVPTAHITDYLVQLSKTQSNTIEGWVNVVNAGKPFDNQQVELRIPELGIKKKVELDKTGNAKFSFATKLVLWQPDAPKLYAVELAYQQELVRDKIGFRTIQTQGENILLNGKSIFLRGISIHEESPLHPGRAWSDADARYLLTAAKELGCNFVRLAHYPHSESMVRMADEMGLLIWSEIPVYWTVLFDNVTVYDKADSQLTEMIARDKNRAAVILWSIANETPNTPSRLTFLNKLAQHARTLDGSRLLTAAMDTQSSASGGKVIDDPLAAVIDVIGINSYCGWYSATPDSCASLQWLSSYHKPAIMSEFGADALQGNHGDKHQRWTEEYQADVYTNNFLMIDNIGFLRGMSPWILKDFRSPRRPLPVYQDFWNRKGLLSEKGIKKQSWYLLHDYYLKKSADAAMPAAPR